MILKKKYLIIFAMSLLIWQTTMAQVNIKERLEIGSNARRPSDSQTVDILFYWFAFYDGNPSHEYPFHLEIGTGNPVGFDPYTGSVTGNYSETITWEDYDSYGGVTSFTIPDAQGGGCILTAIADTNANTFSEQWGAYWADIYVDGQLDTTIIFDFRLDAGFFPNTVYKGVSAYCFWPFQEENCVSDTLNFSFSGIQDVQHGEIRGIQPAVVDNCGNQIYDFTGYYFRFELTPDSLGFLLDPISGKKGVILDSVNSTWVQFCAWGKEPTTPLQANIKISSDDGSIPPDSTTFTVLPPEVRVIAGKPSSIDGDTTSILMGDSTMLTMQVRTPNGVWMDKPVDWSSTFQIVRGERFGFMYNLDSSKVDTIINGYPIVVYSSYPDEKPGDGKVLIQLYSHEPCTDCQPTIADTLIHQSTTSGQHQSQNKTSKTKTASSVSRQKKSTTSLRDDLNDHYGVVQVMLDPEILLGETKYYQTKLVGNKLRIEEHGTPQSDGLTGVHFTVEKYSDQNDPKLGQRLGVYYEYKDSTGANLDSTQQIRLVGRYWTQDSIYKVKLTANYSGKSASWNVEIVRPSHLGYNDNSASNIKGGADNLDSMIISYAGIYGVHPQMIKGIVKRESHFRPSYRYEPFYDIAHIQQIKNTPYLGNFIYKVNSNGFEGTPGIPSDHQNVDPYYHGYVGTIWDFFSQHSSAINPQATSDLYPRREDVWAPEPFKTWDKTYRSTEMKMKKLGKNSSDAESAALDSAKNWLRYNYASGIMDTATAQTRTASSYGLLQIMYPTANMMGYPRGNDKCLPEYLNINDTLFQYAVSYVLKCLGDELRFEKGTSPNNWNLGIDSTYSLALSRYNGFGHGKKGKLVSTAGSKYGPDVRRKGLTYKIRK